MQRTWVGKAGLLSALAAVSYLLLNLAATGCIEEDTTEFGNPNTLSRQNLPGEAGVTPVVSGCAVNFDGGCPSFNDNIYPYLTSVGAWKCADPACHGGVSKPDIKCDSPNQCFDSLSAIQVDGKPYLSAGAADPANARMLCSLQGTCTDKMPKPPGADPTSDDLCIIDTWLKCGSPR